ncbi:MAG: hypothetical protein JJU06_14470 [Ectothiorhodospiraceae bacterium]|nr:hypothetical protein [Ectothiorhodospiraceae bacterium]MCH8503102.1 hypothetical protein [Ectothiorhodospiraceae bacterium]
MQEDNEREIPLLTDRVCPGDELLKRGLWLPLRARGADARAPDDSAWRDRLPPELQKRGDLILQAVMKRLNKD